MREPTNSYFASWCPFDSDLFCQEEAGCANCEIARQPSAWLRRDRTEAIHEQCCGFDGHQDTVLACVITLEGKESRIFGNTSEDLLRLANWLSAKGVTSAAMKGTGVYWQPVGGLPEGLGLMLVVVNALPVQAPPGRKSDVEDTQQIAALLRYELVPF